MINIETSEFIVKGKHLRNGPRGIEIRTPRLFSLKLLGLADQPSLDNSITLPEGKYCVFWRDVTKGDSVRETYIDLPEFYRVEDVVRALASVEGFEIVMLPKGSAHAI